MEDENGKLVSTKENDKNKGNEVLFTPHYMRIKDTKQNDHIYALNPITSIERTF